MTALNNNGFLCPTGVGVFGWGKDDEVLLAWQPTVLNVAGWIPGVSLIAGIASILLGQRFKQKDSAFGAALITRGVLQIAQVGILLAPFDIGFSLVRLVREHLKYRATPSAQAMHRL